MYSIKAHGEGRSFLIFTLDGADGHRHGPAILFPKKQSTLGSEYQACWDFQPLGMLWTRETILVHAWNST